MKKNFICLTIAALFLFISNAYSQKNVAYSWNEDFSGSNNIVPMYTITAGAINVKSLGKFIYETLKPALALQPIGHKVIRIHSQAIEQIIHNDPRDFLYSSVKLPSSVWDYNGTSYNAIWLNYGTDSLKKAFTRFFAALKDSGVVLDEIVLDTENDENRSNLELNADLRYGGGETTTGKINRLNYYKAINADDRFEKTFKDTFMYYLGYYHDSLLYSDVFKSWDSASYVWNNMATILMKNYKDTGVYFPIKSYYPNIRFSEYNYRYYSKKYPVPGKAGHPIYDWGKGTHIGTHQTVKSYGDVRNKLVSEGKGIPLNIYPATVFNALVYDINNLRAATLSSPVPVKSWIASKNWPGDDAFAYLYENNDYYQELVLHTLLSGSGIIYWNHMHTAASDKLMSDLLHQFDTLTGYGLGIGYKAPKKTISDLWTWGYRGKNDTCCSNYLITSMKINSTTVDYDTLWRFTPLLSSSPLSTIDSNSMKKMVVSSSNPVKIRLKYDKSLVGGGKVIGFDTIVFPGATRIIYSTDTLSPNGFWIVNTKSTSGINPEQGKLPEIKIYPNPTKGILNIQSDDQIGEIKLFNLLGENVLNHSSPSTTINISNLPTGVYTMAIETKKHHWSYKKLVLEK